MRVKMLISRVGVNETFDGGKEYDLHEVRAARWIESGFAVAVEIAPIEFAVSEPVAEVAIEEPVIELAVIEPVRETATKHRRRK